MPLVEVVPVPFTNEMVEPSKFIFSAEPSITFPTVKVRDLINCPASIVEIDAPLNKLVADASSVNVPPTAVADKVGASLTGTTVILEAIANAVVLTLGADPEPLSTT